MDVPLSAHCYLIAKMGWMRRHLNKIRLPYHIIPPGVLRNAMPQMPQMPPQMPQRLPNGIEIAPYQPGGSTSLGSTPHQHISKPNQVSIFIITISKNETIYSLTFPKTYYDKLIRVFIPIGISAILFANLTVGFRIK